MSRGKLYAGLVALGTAALIVFWPAPRVDVSPVFERPERPTHPISIYTPKVLR